MERVPKQPPRPNPSYLNRLRQSQPDPSCPEDEKRTTLKPRSDAVWFKMREKKVFHFWSFHHHDVPPGARGLLPVPPPCKNHLFLACLPGEVDLLSEGDGGIVVGELANGGAVGAGEGDTVVDVEDAVGAARGVDVAGGGDGVGLGVDLALGPDAASADGGLGRGGVAGRLAEVVGRVEGAGHAALELSVAVVRAVDDGELEAAGVLEVQVELAVLGLLGRVVAGSDVGLEAVEAEGNDLAETVSSNGPKQVSTCSSVLTVLSGEMLVETVPCGQPLPEKVALVIWIWFASGPSDQPSGEVWAMGPAAASAGRRKAKERMLTDLIGVEDSVEGSRRIWRSEAVDWKVGGC